ncbi:MAG TPA: EAL domain-containing response regulator [Polyangiaceae bacterium]|jgi:EAL domain-containing protein (putative c-di-GMP-specific phosphodiesterase class I)|nr:EAL domain-containing response regulator [Polyangiaceae bacterium]
MLSREGASAAGAERAPSRVLLADDDPELRRAIARTLERGGFTVQTAEDGLRAAALLAEESFDAVLTDVAMPKMSGIDLLRVARERDLEIPVLLMTGAPDVSSAIDAVKHGACEYIIKPFEGPKLLQLVRRAVDLSRLARAKREAMRELGSTRPEAGDRAGLEVTLIRAIETLWMAYQPIVDFPARTVFGYEALLRSAEPALPNPGAVIEAATNLGRLHDVGRAVRAIAGAPMSRIAAETLLFVNLHARDLEDPTLTDPSSPLAAMAPRVIFEITERSSLEGVREAKERVAHLRQMGFRVAIDDLGAGYAGLTSFAMLEPEFVKLDMSIVRDVHSSPVKQKLVGSMTALCNDMGITVIAEGIETIAERDCLLGLGCRLLQGYLIARPGKAFPDCAW